MSETVLRVVRPTPRLSNVLSRLGVDLPASAASPAALNALAPAAAGRRQSTTTTSQPASRLTPASTLSPKSFPSQVW